MRPGTIPLLPVIQTGSHYWHVYTPAQTEWHRMMLLAQSPRRPPTFPVEQSWTLRVPFCEKACIMHHAQCSFTKKPRGHAPDPHWAAFGPDGSAAMQRQPVVTQHLSFCRRRALSLLWLRVTDRLSDGREFSTYQGISGTWMKDEEVYRP
jgi:hypothetical protein